MCEKMDRIQAARTELIYAMRGNLPDECAEVIDRIECDDKGHMLSWSLDNPLQVSYASKPDHTYDPVKRMRTSLGRYLSRNYGVEITPTINSAIERIFGEIAYNGDRFAVRDDVCEIYNTVAESCMTDMSCVEFYENNGVRVVCYTPPGCPGPIARALLWKTDKGEYLDRIYPNSGPHIEHYVKWAANRGCEIRPHHSMGNIRTDHRIYKVRVGPMPYLDTFCDLSGTTLSTDGDGLTCHNTEGEEPTECRNCSNWTFGDDTDGYCKSCYDNLCRCEQCSKRYDSDDMTEIEGQSVCESCAENASSCDRCDHTVWETSHIDGQHVCESCAEEAHCCERCEDSVFQTSEIDGQDVCESCAEEAHECEECSESYFAELPLFNGGRELCIVCSTDASSQAPNCCLAVASDTLTTVATC